MPGIDSLIREIKVKILKKIERKKYFFTQLKTFFELT